MIDTNWTDEERVLYPLYFDSLLLKEGFSILTSQQISNYPNVNLDQKQVLEVLHRLKEQGRVGYLKQMVFSEYDCKYHPMQGWYCTGYVLEKIYDVALDDETTCFTKIYGDETNTFESNRRFLDWYHRQKENVE